MHKEKMEQIPLDYGLPKETVTTIMMLYKNMKAIARSFDGDADFFYIVAGICLDYVQRTSTDLIKENSFKKRQEAENILQKQ